MDATRLGHGDLGLIEVAIIWTIIARYLPVADMGTLIQNMLQHKPLLVTE